MAESARKSMSVEEFFDWQMRQEELYELVDGFPVPRWHTMTGASRYHDAIVVNILTSLKSQLKGSRCQPTTPDNGVRTRIKGIRRPDVTVTCDEPQANRYEAGDPRLVVEVVSPSNEGVSWQRKIDEYRRLQGLTYILLVESRAMQATLYTRRNSDWEPLDADGPEAVIDLPEIGCRLTMRDVYEGLSFPSPDAEAP